MKSLPALTLALPLLLAGCAMYTVSTIPYAAQPSRIRDPQKEAMSIILANTVQGCVTEPQISDTMLVVKYVCSNGIGNSVARLDRVQSITIEKGGEWYRVTVHHSPGIEDFKWTSKSLEDMERLADALTALSQPGGPATSAPKPAHPI